MCGYLCLIEGGSGQITEKNSRFIATVKSVSTEEEASAFIMEMKKKYWDAKHNCSAFVIGSAGEMTRCSDDGEPPGTAGRPMLEVLLKSGIRNVCVVVTRYFGGTLLGTGGLIRAYQAAVKAGLKDCAVVSRQTGTVYSVETDYHFAGKLQHLFAEKQVREAGSDYGQSVSFRIVLTEENREDILKRITDLTAGEAKITEQGTQALDVPADPVW